MDYLNQLYAFNRGLVSSLALARLDIKRLALSASVFTNWMTRVLGPMMLRPGLQFLSTTLNNQYAAHLDFQFSTSDTAVIELTAGGMRVRVNDVIVTRPAVTSTFNDWSSGPSSYIPGTSTSSTFADSTDLGKWHSTDDSGASSSLFPGGGLALLGTGLASARRNRSVNVSGANLGVEHEITIVVARGKVVVRIGSSEGDDSYLEDRLLRAGTHCIAFTPSSPFFVELSAYLISTSVVASVTIRQVAGDMIVPTPWLTATQLDMVRWDQSGDVIFAGCTGVAPQRIERQDRLNSPPSRSWSVVEYFPEDGPFGDLNTGPVQLQTDGISGDVNLIASTSFFKPGHVGGLFRLTSAGQEVAVHITGQNVFTDPIEVTGVGASRQFVITLTAADWSHGTVVTIQRSPATPGNWTDQASYSAVGTYPFNDLLDNQIMYYRIGVKTGDFHVGDDITADMVFSAGSIRGVVRVRSITDPTHAKVSVLKALGAQNVNTQNWYEGDWSPKNGYPGALTLFGGRLWWAGASLFWGSVASLFDSFNDDITQGDAATIRGELGSGPVDTVNWMLALNNLMIGADGEAKVAQASSITGPITPTDKGLKTSTNVGTAALRAIKIDTQGIFVARDGTHVMELSADANLYTLVPYIPTDLTALVPDIGVPAFKRVAVQNAKERRVHCVRTDGQVAIMIRNKAENVNCWLMFQAGGGGLVEDVVTLPGTIAAPLEDQVYYVVNRTINGATLRSFEKWSLESQSTGAADTRLVDCHLTGTASNATTLSLPWLVGQTVALWGNGVDLGTFVVSGAGTISGFPALNGPYAAGLPYTAQWQSTKLAVGSRHQAPVNQYKDIDHIGLVLQDTHAQGLLYGSDFDHMDGLPTVEDGAIVDPNSIWSQYDRAMIPMDGSWKTDARICLQAASPRPCTVLGIVIGGDGHETV